MRQSRHSMLVLDRHEGEPCVRLVLAPRSGKALAMVAMRWFDDDLRAAAGMVADLPAFVERARRIDPDFEVPAEALDFILESRDNLRRAAMASAFDRHAVENVLSEPLYPLQVDAVLAAFAAGRFLIADEPGTGGHRQALATACLMQSAGIAGNVLVVCPTSLKYRWLRDIKNLAKADATVIEGPHQQRRELYACGETGWNIVSYHSLATDVKAIGTVRADLVILDAVDRASSRTGQIAKALRSVESDLWIYLSALPPAMLPAPFAAMKSVARTSAELCSGARPAECVPVPMTKEQRAIYNDALGTAGHLVRKWNTLHYLSEKERRRLMVAVATALAVCDSTVGAGSAERHDTKIDEALAVAATELALRPDAKVVIFTRSAALGRVVSEEAARLLPEEARLIVASDTRPGALRNATLVINVGIAGSDADTRLAITAGDVRCRVVTLVSAGTIEETIAGGCLSAPMSDALFGSHDRITVDDDTLGLCASAFQILGIGSRTEQESVWTGFPQT